MISEQKFSSSPPESCPTITPRVKTHPAPVPALPFQSFQKVNKGNLSTSTNPVGQLKVFRAHKKEVMMLLQSCDRLWMSSDEKVAIFIGKLWSLLENYTRNPNLVQWTQGGKAFAILDTEQLCNTYLARYFKHTKFTSFVRQLNMYNFKRVRGSQFEWEYRHKLFRKNRKNLLPRIKRNRTQKQVTPQGQQLEELDIEREGESDAVGNSGEEKPQGSPTGTQILEGDEAESSERIRKENQYLKKQKDILKVQEEEVKATISQQGKKVESFLYCYSAMTAPRAQFGFNQNAFFDHFKSSEPAFSHYNQYLRFSLTVDYSYHPANMNPGVLLFPLPGFFQFPNFFLESPAAQLQH